MASVTQRSVEEDKDMRHRQSKPRPSTLHTSANSESANNNEPTVDRRIWLLLEDLSSENDNESSESSPADAGQAGDKKSRMHRRYATLNVYFIEVQTQMTRQIIVRCRKTDHRGAPRLGGFLSQKSGPSVFCSKSPREEDSHQSRSLPPSL